MDRMECREVCISVVQFAQHVSVAFSEGTQRYMYIEQSFVKVKNMVLR